MKHWTLIGGSPNARAAYATIGDLRTHGPNYVTITTNHGLDIIDTPTFYFVTDVMAREWFRPKYLEARARGTKIVTPRRNDPAMMACADILIDVEKRADHRIYRRNSYVPVRLSGLFMLQFALNNGATDISMMGFDGYNPDPKQHNDDAAAFLTSAVATHPHVSFWFYGNAQFHLPQAPNFVSIGLNAEAMVPA